MKTRAFSAEAQADGSVTIIHTEAVDGGAPVEIERWELSLEAAGALAGDIVRAAIDACFGDRKPRRNPWTSEHSRLIDNEMIEDRTGY